MQYVDAVELVRFVQFARASSVPAGRNSRSIGRGVRGFKLVMVSAVTWSRAQLTQVTTFARRGSRSEQSNLAGAGIASTGQFGDVPRVHDFLRAVQLASASSDPAEQWANVEAEAEETSGGVVAVVVSAIRFNLANFRNCRRCAGRRRTREGHQFLKLSVSSLVQLASGSNEPGEGAASRRGAVRQSS